MNPATMSINETIERFRQTALRSLDAVKHCDMKPHEKEVDTRLRNTIPADWSVQDMSIIINTDKRINHPKP